MANKKKMEQQRIMLEELRKKRRNILYASISVVVAVIVIVAVISLLGSFNHTPTTSSNLSSVNSGTYVKLSSNDIGSSGVNVYFLSWQGCPIGAADSWAIYDYFHTYFKLSNSTIIKGEHFSDPSESPSNIPGLLLNNFSATSSGITYHFHVVYVYGESLPSTDPSPASVNTGITALKSQSGFPSQVINEFVTYETAVPTVGLSNQAIACYAGHVTSSLIITGPGGTYYFEGEMYNPQIISGIQPSTLLGQVSSYSQITTSMTNLDGTVNSAV